MNRDLYMLDLDEGVSFQTEFDNGLPFMYIR